MKDLTKLLLAMTLGTSPIAAQSEDLLPGASIVPEDVLLNADTGYTTFGSGSGGGGWAVPSVGGRRDGGATAQGVNNQVYRPSGGDRPSASGRRTGGGGRRSGASGGGAGSAALEAGFNPLFASDTGYTPPALPAEDLGFSVDGVGEINFTFSSSVSSRFVYRGNDILRIYQQADNDQSGVISVGLAVTAQDLGLTFSLDYLRSIESDLAFVRTPTDVRFGSYEELNFGLYKNWDLTEKLFQEGSPHSLSANISNIFFLFPNDDQFDSRFMNRFSVGLAYGYAIDELTQFSASIDAESYSGDSGSTTGEGIFVKAAIDRVLMKEFKAFGRPWQINGALGGEVFYDDSFSTEGDGLTYFGGLARLSARSGRIGCTAELREVWDAGSNRASVSRPFFTLGFDVSF